MGTENLSHQWHWKAAILYTFKNDWICFICWLNRNHFIVQIEYFSLIVICEYYILARPDRAKKKTVFCRTASLQSCFPHLSIKYSCTAAGCSCNFTSSRSPKDSHCIPGLLAPHRCLLLCLFSLSIRLDRYSQIITFINFREFTKVAQAISGVNVTTSGSTRGENRAFYS